MQTENRDRPISHQSSILPARSDLEVFMRPQSVALIGASERVGSVGQTLLTNLSNGPLKERLYLVNPRHRTLQGREVFSRIEEVPAAIDLAVIATPAVTVPDLIRQCVAKAVDGAIIISAGFAEMGGEGRAFEQEIKAAQGGSKLRIVGPNCLGIMAPYAGLNATFATAPMLRGNLALLSQSGALLTAILDWSIQEKLGFSAVVSVGSMLDVSWGEWIDYLGDDPQTHSILVYMESIGNARSFLSAARAVAPHKPIIVLKAGRSPAAAKAAVSHTGAMAGRDDVLDAAFRRVGVLRVESVADLFSMAEVLAKQPRPSGPRLTILTNAGGAGVVATDALERYGARSATLSESTTFELNQILPSHWSRSNPVDILGDASPARYRSAFKAILQEPATDGHLVILTPQAMTDPVECARQLAAEAHECKKPVLASWMGGQTVAPARAILAESQIADFEYPEAAAQAFAYMWRYSDNLRAIYETPAAVTELPESACVNAGVVLDAVKSAGRTLLHEVEAKQVIGAYGIPTIETRIATSRAEAVYHAGKLGYPAVLKLLSPTITHKSDVGGVRLNLCSASEVGYAFSEIEGAVTAKFGASQFAGVTVQRMIVHRGLELILGSICDEQFGPVLLFGAGGITTEVFRDRALGLPPLNRTLARLMMEQTRIYQALVKPRGQSIDLDALEELLVRFSQLVIDHPRIREIDINPLIVDGDRMLALDARIVLHGADLQADCLPCPAIRPYPSQYTTSIQLPAGQPATIRAIRPEDEDLMVKFHQTLSIETAHQRYGNVLPLAARIGHHRLSRICFADYDRDIVLVVEIGQGQERRIIAVGRLSKMPGSGDHELALLVGDAFQRQGLGGWLLKQLLNVAQQERMSCVRAFFAPNNVGMERLCHRYGFVIVSDADQCEGTHYIRA